MPEVVGGGGGSVTASSLAGYQLDYVEKTTNTVVSATVRASADTILSTNAVVFDGSPVVLHWQGTGCAVTGGASNFAALVLFEGSTEITGLQTYTPASGTAVTFPVSGYYRFTPSAGSHTYTIKGYRGSANATFTAGAGGTGADGPFSIRITKA